MNIGLTLKSSNAKVGQIPVTTSSHSTCPPSCALIGHYDDNGKWIKGPCYADSGFHTALHWDKVTSGERGTPYNDFIEKITSLKPGQLWRHNVAGDLQGKNDVIDQDKLRQLTEANTGKRGFTYTHYPITKKKNRDSIAYANNSGFTVNVSANSPSDAIDIRKAYKLPTVTIVPSDYWATGNKVGDIVRCPAEYKDTNCKQCQLCQRSERAVIVGFTAHGSQAKAADIIASAS